VLAIFKNLFKDCDGSTIKRAISSRYDKLERNYASMLSLAFMLPRATDVLLNMRYTTKINTP
ncbi:hypothetical protein AB6E26_27340, partial [Vibrio splendidus]